MMLEIIRERLASSARTRIAFFTALCAVILLGLAAPLHRSGAADSLFAQLKGAELNVPVSASSEQYHAAITDAHHAAITQLRPKRVAIIGAGASGSSAAFFLRRAARTMAERIDVDPDRLVNDIVVFDREARPGGRSTTVHPYDNDNMRPIELGASVFVEANKHMNKAAQTFGFTLKDPDFNQGGLGIWDGQNLLYTTSSSKSIFSGIWDTLSAAWRYGPLSITRTNWAVSAMLKQFAQLYNPKWLLKRGPVRSVEDFAETVGLGAEFTTKTGEDWAMHTVGVGDKWLGEVMEGSTRVNYASDMTAIHAFGAAVSMATSGAKSIAGGNWQVFDAMLKNASAILHMETTVTEILPYLDEDGQRMFQIKTNTTNTSDIDKPFDIVFFAAPWHLSPVNHKLLEPYFDEEIPQQTYVRLHVTMFSTFLPHPAPSFFGANYTNASTIPSTILTTAYTSRLTPGVPPPAFQSMSWLGETLDGSGEHVVKIFSRMPISDSFISDVLGGEQPGWVHRKIWDSYPELRPIERYPPVEPTKGLHYLAAMEPWVSTMETQTISGREAVARVVEEWWGLGLGECKGGADAWDWTCTR